MVSAGECEGVPSPGPLVALGPRAEPDATVAVGSGGISPPGRGGPKAAAKAVKLKLSVLLEGDGRPPPRVALPVPDAALGPSMMGGGSWKMRPGVPPSSPAWPSSRKWGWGPAGGAHSGSPSRTLCGAASRTQIRTLFSVANGGNVWTRTGEARKDGPERQA